MERPKYVKYTKVRNRFLQEPMWGKIIKWEETTTDEFRFRADILNHPDMNIYDMDQISGGDPLSDPDAVLRQFFTEAPDELAPLLMRLAMNLD